MSFFWLKHQRQCFSEINSHESKEYFLTSVQHLNLDSLIFLFFLKLTVVVQSLNCVWLSDPMDCSTPRLPCPLLYPGVLSNSRPLSHEWWWCFPTILFSVTCFSSCLQSFPASGSFPVSWLFTSGGQSINPSNEYSGLISFRINWFDLLEVHGTLKGLLQCQNLKASILLHSVFFMVQLSHLYMTVGKTITLTTWTFVSKVMSLLFNRFVIVFFPKSKGLLISWLQSWAAVILEPKKTKSVTVCTFPPPIC